MGKLTELLFWRNSSPLSIPAIMGDKVIAEQKKVTITVTEAVNTTQLETYVQIDPDSGEPIERLGAPFDSSSKKRSSEVIQDSQNATTEFYKSLVQEACLVRGTEIPGFPVPLKYPDWLNRQLIEEGKRFVRKHYFAITFAHLTAIFILLTIKPIQALLIRSTRKVFQKKEAPNNALLVYLKFFLQLQKWYKMDFADDFSDVQIFRHRMAESASNFRKFIPPLTDDLNLTDHENLKFATLRYDLSKTQNDISDEELKTTDRIRTTVNPEVPLSQYDLAVIQFSLYGLISMFPKTFGVYESSEKSGLEGFVHLWALFGNLLGLRDEFNMALQTQNTQLTQVQVFQNIFRFSFRMVDMTGFRLWKSMFLGTGKYFHTFLIPFDTLLMFVMHTLYGVFGSNPTLDKKKTESSYWIIMSLWAKLCFNLHNFCFGILLRNCIFRSFFNGMARAVLCTGWFIYIRNRKQETSHITLDVKWSQKNGVEIIT